MLASVEGLVSDMDGVLWRGPSPLPGVAQLLGWLRGEGIPFALATNNSSREPREYVKRLAEMGAAIDAERIVTSALAAADWLLRTRGPGIGVHALGGSGLKAALEAAGMRLLAEGRPDQAEVVAAGIDFDLTYRKLAAAARQISGGAAFVGTNGDVTYPSEDGLLPGAGSILAALQACTGVAPFVIGKPGPAIFEMALRRLGTPAERTVMVGDRLDTDIVGARRAGLRTILVLTGIDSAEAAAGAETAPDLIVRDLPHLLALWRSCRRPAV